MYMDTHDGPSSSFQPRGRGGRNYNTRGGWNSQGGGYQSGRNSSRGGGGRSNYSQYDNVHPPPRGRYDEGRYNDGGNRYSNGSGFGGNQQGAYRGSGRQQPRGRGSWGNTNTNRGGRSSNYRGGARGGRPPPKQKYDQPADIEFVGVLKGHTGTVTAMAYDSNTSQLYTGSKDETVRLWDCKGRGECLSVVQVGGQVDSLLLEGGFLFVGLRVQGMQPVPGLIKVYNLQIGAQHDLAGHTEEIFALAAANGLLLSAGKDMSIRVWKLDTASSTFQPTGVITAAQGGHQAPVQALLPFGAYLVSADWAGAIKLWDMASGQCMQTIQHAHKEPIMRLLQWENVLISCSLDSSIKVWQPIDPPTPGAVMDMSPVYVQPPEEPGKPPENWGGVLAISGAIDGAQRPLLLASYNDDGCVRLYDLPSFADRGHLPAMRDARALAAAPGNILAAGDGGGTVKLWRWRPAPMPLT